MTGKKRAFTLIEILVVAAIIGVLAMLTVVNVNSARAKSRDTKRKADLIELKNAVELYALSNNNKYPSTGGSTQWWSQVDPTHTVKNDCFIPFNSACLTNSNDSNTNPYITQIPHDPRRGKSYVATGNCTDTDRVADYLYASNGSSYKILAYCSPEVGLGTDSNDPFYDPARSQTDWQVSSDADARTSW